MFVARTKIGQCRLSVGICRVKSRKRSHKLGYWTENEHPLCEKSRDRKLDHDISHAISTKGIQELKSQFK